MKVYIGWSGQTSKEVASILKSWLPLMNSHIETFFTLTDVQLGMNWQTALSRAILDSDCALFCLTKDNIDSPWFSYEAGMMSVAEKPVISILFDAPLSCLTSPLRQFQIATFEKKSVWEMVSFLNQLCGQDASTSEELLAKFEGLYPTIEKMLAQVRDLRKERPQDNQTEQNAEDLKRDFATVNSKLDIILSRLKPYLSQENSL